MKKHVWFMVFLLSAVLCLSNIALFAELKEHAVIKPIPKSILEKSSEHKDYTYEFPLYDKGKNIVNYKEIKGTFWKLTYNVFGKDSQRKDGVFSSIEIIRTYKDFAIEKGGKILWERSEGGRLTFTIPMPGGGNTWCHVSARNGYYELDIVEKETLGEETPSVAREMKKELDLKGQLIVYSILFDFDKYDLKKASTKPVGEIGELLLSFPGLKIEIQGHTDNQGDDEYNLKLSQKRADSVKLYLTSLGVDASRLTAKGYGSTKPVASNNTRDGRAKNRRVVLVER
jgi:outer membrane protein OmpA-like peptidoglycan-associated protein